MQPFIFIEANIVDVNTGQKITAKFDTGTGLASPDSWGMVRWHPHAPVLQLPPRKTYLLAGIPQDAVLGTLRDSDLSKGLETLVGALSDRLARLELPPGQRGNPLPVHEVISQEFKRLYPDDDDEETNIYRKQVYTWRHSDIVRAAGRLHLSIGDLFSAGAARPQDFINFAGDTYYVDPRRLEEPNCEPRMEDAMLLDNGKTLVFRPKHGPRDRPATWHNNYSEVTGGRPDPLHDFGIKSIKSDAPWGGYVTGHRYACCWQAMGSPGCLIGYPSASRKHGEVRNEQGCLERASGFPVLYQWFGGFPPSDQTVNFRGIAFKDREYADALHEKIVTELRSVPDLIAKLARKPSKLSAQETRVIAQVARWMHEYNAPLMGCALYPVDDQVDESNVEEYLDRVLVGRGQPAPKQAKPLSVPTEVTQMLASAKRHSKTAIISELEAIVQTYKQGTSVRPEVIAERREQLVREVPLYAAVDTNDQWLLAAKRSALRNERFVSAVNILQGLTKDDLVEKKEIEAALLSPEKDFKQVLIDVQKDKKFLDLYAKGDTKGLETYVEKDMYLKKLLGYLLRVQATEYAEPEEAGPLLAFAKKKAFRRPEKEMEAEFARFEKKPLRPIKGILLQLEFALGRELTQENLGFIREKMGELLQKYKNENTDVTAWDSLSQQWTLVYKERVTKYFIPEQARTYFKEFLSAYYEYLKDPAKATYPQGALTKWENQRLRLLVATKQSEDDEFIARYVSIEEPLPVADLEKESVRALRLIREGNEELRLSMGFKFGDADAEAVIFVGVTKEVKTWSDLHEWQARVYAAQPRLFQQSQGGLGISHVPIPMTEAWEDAYAYMVSKIYQQIRQPEKDVEQYVKLVKEEATRIINEA